MHRARELQFLEKNANQEVNSFVEVLWSATDIRLSFQAGYSKKQIF